MRRIEKGEEPNLRLADGRTMTLSTWRRFGDDGTPPTTWDALRNPMKGDLHDVLMREQGNVCCYFGIRISRGKNSPPPKEGEFDIDGSHIEHVLPRKHYASKTFDYENLLVSCEGGQGRRGVKQTHCGDKKGSWPSVDDEHLFVTPMASGLADFRYTPSGEVKPRPALPTDRFVAVQETIQRLGLNDIRLKLAREIAIKEVFGDLEEMTYSAQEQFARRLIGEAPESMNNFEITPFLAAIRCRLLLEGFSA